MLTKTLHNSTKVGRQPFVELMKLTQIWAKIKQVGLEVLVLTDAQVHCSLTHSRMPLTQ